MKNKFFPIVYAGISAFSVALIESPTYAQKIDLSINFEVPEMIFLQTIPSLDIKLTPSDLGSSGLTVNGIYRGFDSSSSSDGRVNTVTPFTGAAGTIYIKQNQVYSVFSNKGAHKPIKITMGIDKPTLTGPAGSSIVITAVTTTLDNGITGSEVSTTARGLNTAIVGSANLSLSLKGNQTAGTYTNGVIFIKAEAP